MPEPDRQTIAAFLTEAAGHVRAGRFARAADAFTAAIQNGDDSVTTLANLAQCLLRSGKTADAEPVMRRVLVRDPNHLDALVNLGGVLALSERADEGEAFLRRAVAVNPGHAAAQANLAMALEKQERYAEALAAADRTIALNPRSAEANFIAGTCHAHLGALGAAVEAYRRSILLNPGRSAAYINLAAILQEAGRSKDALDVIERAVVMAPDNAKAQFNRAMLLFATGDLNAAWRTYHWRWKTPDIVARWRDFPAPQWTGAPLPKGKKLLVWSEQGVGDEILFGSMLPDLAARGIDTVFECDARLVKIFARSFPKVAVVARTDPAAGACTGPSVAAQIPAADLGQFLRPTWDSFGVPKPFLAPDKRRVAAIRKSLRSKARPLVAGLSWLSFNRAFQDRKSMPLPLFQPMLANPDISWIDFQYGDTARERAAAPEAEALRTIEGLDLKDDLDGVAAAISACDVVVTVCNTLAHLAGALGVPAYVLVPKGRGRLWWTFEDGGDSPWYGSVRFYRQTEDGDWAAPCAALCADLNTLAIRQSRQTKPVAPGKPRKKAR